MKFQIPKIFSISARHKEDIEPTRDWHLALISCAILLISSALAHYFFYFSETTSLSVDTTTETRKLNLKRAELEKAVSEMRTKKIDYEKLLESGPASIPID